MSSRPLRVDKQHKEADLAVGEMLADDADQTTPINHPRWRNRVAGGTPNKVAIENSPTIRPISIRTTITLATALAELARADGLPREAWIKNLLADYVAERLNIPIGPLLAGPGAERYAHHYRDQT